MHILLNRFVKFNASLYGSVEMLNQLIRFQQRLKGALSNI